MFLTGFAFICSGQSFTQSAERDPVAIVELGGVASGSLTDFSDQAKPTSRDHLKTGQ
jgi:hypothetical protein